METISRAVAKQAGLKYYFTGMPCAYGHVSDRFVRNHTCVECDEIRGHKANPPIDPLPQCRICGSQVRAYGHATCSTTCQKLWEKAKARVTLEKKKPKHCHGCGVVHNRYHKRFCSDECYQTHLQSLRKRAIPETRKCVICAVEFTTTRPHQTACSRDCAKRREVQRHIAKKNWRQRHDRENYAAEVRERSRRLRIKVAAAVELARDLGIEPRPIPFPEKKVILGQPPQETKTDEEWLFDFFNQVRKRAKHRRACIVCGGRLYPTGALRADGVVGRPRTTFCSKTCYLTHNLYKSRYKSLCQTMPRPCPRCGELFRPTNTRKHYCSSACHEGAVEDANRKRYRAKARDPAYREQKRRRERKRTAIKIAFEQLGLLSTGEQT